LLKEKRGELPKYLIQRKLEWAKREQDRLAEMQKEKVPKGHTRIILFICSVAESGTITHAKRFKR
jgi:hypothetical protein